MSLHDIPHIHRCKIRVCRRGRVVQSGNVSLSMREVGTLILYLGSGFLDVAHILSLVVL